MDSSVSPKDEIWFLRVCHHISTGFYQSRIFYVVFLPVSVLLSDITWSLVTFIRISGNICNFIGFISFPIIVPDLSYLGESFSLNWLKFCVIFPRCKHQTPALSITGDLRQSITPHFHTPHTHTHNYSGDYSLLDSIPRHTSHSPAIQ